MTTGELPLTYEITTPAAPVQAEGVVAGRRFYFRARHEAWSFAVAEQPGVAPVDLAPGESGRGWVREGTFADRYAGSYLSAADADALIRACAAAYIAERGGAGERPAAAT